MNVAAGGAVGWRSKGPLIKPLPPPPPPQAPSQVRGRGRTEIRKQSRLRSSARRRQRQVLILRSSTKAGARRPFSRFLASPLEVRSCRATRRASCQSRKPQTLLLPVAHPTLRYPRLHKGSSSSNRKNAGMCSSENRSRQWGPLVSLPDPEPDQPEQDKTTKAKGKTTEKARGRSKGKRIRFFAGSLEPLLAARKRRRYNIRRPQSSLTADRDPNAGDDGAEYEYLDKAGDIDADADADDDGVWSGEYMPMIPTIVVTEPDAEPEMVVVRFTPEEVERAIGAAFAIYTSI